MKRLSIWLAFTILVGPACGASSEDLSDAGTCSLEHAQIEDPVAEPGHVKNVLDDCESDSGPCMANTACTGAAQDRVCELSQLIAADAALCIARAGGMPEGLEPPVAYLLYNYKLRRIVWSVTTALTRSSPDAGPGGFYETGIAWAIDAVTGELLSQDSYRATA